MNGNSRPEWVRIPPVGELEKYSSLSRASIYRLLGSGKIESRKLSVGRGGTRLVRLSSLLAAIEGGGVEGARFPALPRKEQAPEPVSAAG
jgi:hypothetical protein